MNISGKTALVTGASSGLGADFARLLAQRGCDLVLVARRADRMQKLAEQLKEEYAIEVHVFALDLLQTNAAQDLKQQLDSQNINIDILINNAGFGVFGHFTSVDWQRSQQMINLDILVLSHLTKLFVDDMVKRGFGKVLNVASIGAYQPTPTYAAYAGCKAYVLLFSEALNSELKGTGVSITALSPGITETEFLQVSGQKATFYQRLLMMQSLPVAKIGIENMLKGKSSVVPGLINKLTVFFVRFTPRSLQAKVAFTLMKNH